ncbi:MAG: hypothetical protein U0992_23570 [Planctomycetaceae bacterium]
MKKQFADEHQAPAAKVLAIMFEDRPEELYGFAKQATATQLHSLITTMQLQMPHAALVKDLAIADLADVRAGQKVPQGDLMQKRNAFVVLYGVAPEAVDWGLLASGSDNTLRTEVLHALPEAVPQWDGMADRLEHETDAGVAQRRC